MQTAAPLGAAAVPALAPARLLTVSLALAATAAVAGAQTFAWHRLPAPSPVRAEHAWCDDPVRQRTFAVGGRTLPNLGVETAQWDGVGWSSGSTAIGWDDMTGAWFDFNRLRVVAASNYPSSRMEWDGSRWHREAWPNLMVAPRGAFDVARLRAVLVGSDAAGIVTQEWDGTTWMPQVTTALPCAARPVFHGGRGKVVVSCGAGGLWEWNGSAWSQFAPGPGAPWTAVADTNVAYDEARGELVQVAWPAAAIETARWHGAAWTVNAFPNGPPPRRDHGFTFDGSSQCIVLFGGGNPVPGSASFDDLWQWDGVAWTQRVLAHSPSPREKCGLVFDPVRAQLLALGGQRVMTSIATVPVADVFALDSRAALGIAVLGPGCSGTAGVPRLVTGAPHPGSEVFAGEVHWSQPATPTLFGFAFAGGAVGVGAGCTLYLANQDQLMFAAGDAAGIATVSTSIPLALQGFTFVAQAAVLDPSNPLGVSLSAGLRITVGS